MIDTKYRPRLDGDEAVMTVMMVLVGGDDVDDDPDDARRDDDDDGDDLPLRRRISPAESVGERAT